MRQFIQFEGYKLRAFLEFLQSDKAVSGRCGPGTGLKEQIVSESILGLSMTPVCKIHDYEYQEGQTEDEKVEADLNLFDNCMRIVFQGSESRIMVLLRSLIIFWYYFMVMAVGNSAFGHDQNQ